MLKAIWYQTSLFYLINYYKKKNHSKLKIVSHFFRASSSSLLRLQTWFRIVQKKASIQFHFKKTNVYKEEKNLSCLKGHWLIKNHNLRLQSNHFLFIFNWLGLNQMPSIQKREIRTYKSKLIFISNNST